MINNNKYGISIFIGSLFFYFLFKLPFNLSVLCGSSNEGFYFIYGQYLASGGGLRASGGLLNVLVYATVLKIFGFGTSSIIAVHFLHTIVVIFIGIFIYLIARKIFNDNFYSALTVFLWILLQITPTGAWGNILELESILSLEAEYFCLLCSFSSIYYFSRSLNKKNPKILSFISGILATCSVLFKMSGGVLIVAIICWIIYLLLFERQYLTTINQNLIYFFIGFAVCFLTINFLICLLKNDLILYWKNSFLIGSYSTNFLQTPKSFLLMLLKFMCRGKPALNSNFVLFVFAFIFFVWGLIRNIILKAEKSFMNIGIPLLSIWSIGNCFAVLAPGAYASYYYILLWPSIAIFLMIGIKDLFKYNHFLKNQYFKIIIIFFISLFFIHRCSKVLPEHINMIKTYLPLNIFSQSQSFQDPVLPYDINSFKRPFVLKIADLLNGLLPDKNDRIYIFHFAKHRTFGPPIYIYMKRLPPTTEVCDYLHEQRKIKTSVQKLIHDLIQAPPRIFMKSQVLYLKPDSFTLLADDLKPLIGWLNLFLKKNYHLKTMFSYKYSPDDESEIYEIYERNYQGSL